MITRWNKAPGQIIATVYISPSNLFWTRRREWFDNEGNRIPDEIGAWLSEAYPKWNSVATMELAIDFESTGYSDPGRMYGPPENCYPPEGEDERTITRIRVWHDQRTLPESLHDAAFDYWQKRIEAAEIETPEPDYDDTDRWDGRDYNDQEQWR